MKKLHLSSAIQPKNLSAIELDCLTDELFAIHSQIFDGVSKAAFRNYVIEPDTVLSKIFRILNRENETVGYLTFQVYQVSIARNGKIRKPYIFRTEMGILKAYRGHPPINSRLLIEALKFSLRRGIPEAYYMATPINPVAYYLTCRDTGVIYPQPDLETPGHIQAVQKALSHALALPQARPENPLVKQVGWIVKMAPVEVRKLQRSPNPWIQFYLRENPEFEAGNGLMWLAPATLGNGIRSAAKIGKRLLTYRAKRIIPKLPKPVKVLLLNFL